MNRIAGAFADKKAFIPFITAGDPNLEITEKLVPAMAEAGAALVEIGIPFSDPVAEGVVIQKADERALKAGTTTDKIFASVKRIREKTEVPLAFTTYMNPIYTYGTERFLANCRECGIDALIVPDVPFEEKAELVPYCKQYGITLISMLASTSRERIRMIAKEAEGFLYCASSMGVNGACSENNTELKQILDVVKEEKQIPCAIGFGISTAEQAIEISEIADGVSAGSAIVKLLEEYGEFAVEPVRAFVASIVKAVAAV
ncbi:MAG: tryptophan synthase subunit alpha [Clostridia bacterium]|nr:tryptophan synthase subunit alpha [Clostridia bacterium]MDD4572024.1 tryptophan synthase subunit alpha [Clostridia bacterium]